jgi:hypothetical protein
MCSTLPTALSVLVMILTILIAYSVLFEAVELIIYPFEAIFFKSATPVSSGVTGAVPHLK